MVEAGKKISQQSNQYGCIGTSMYVGLAAEGMLKSAALSYADTLSSGIGKAFADNFTRLFDNSAKCSVQKWNEWSKTDVNSTLPEDYRDYIADQSSYANGKSEDLDNSRQRLIKETAALNAETVSPQKIELLSSHLDNWDNIDFEDRRQVADMILSQVHTTGDCVSFEWKI